MSKEEEEEVETQNVLMLDQNLDVQGFFQKDCDNSAEVSEDNGKQNSRGKKKHF